MNIENTVVHELSRLEEMIRGSGRDAGSEVLQVVQPGKPGIDAHLHFQPCFWNLGGNSLTDSQMNIIIYQ